MSLPDHILENDRAQTSDASVVPARDEMLKKVDDAIANALDVVLEGFETG